ncbi:ras-related protein Rap-2b [Anticarsia gemmatalis]|uniref:ras-related protein Rap-2b n=1 Tax=Anticarsia gemmatalis TaxID=129554 RepID=UPI003F7738A3
MKGRHQFRRRFSLQPSFMKEDHEEERRPHRTERTEDTVSSSGNLTNNAVRHKIVVLGAAKVGKSSLITQFLYNSFSPKYKKTIEEMHHGDFNVSGVRLTLDILDTSGAYEFPAMRALSMQSADAFILVYDITDANSFAEVRTLRDQIHETKESTAVPIVVVGNKVDLAETGARQVEFHTTESVVTVDWENGFVEASAKENINVSQIFKELLVQAKVKYNLSPALRRRRRQSLPTGPQGAPGSSPTPPAPHVPSPAQLAHLQQIRERHNSKRNSCVIS